MPYEYTPPKYAQVIGELRRRIESGEYPPGSLLPSEHQLSDEFQIARPTVVRALRVLREDALNRDESREPGEVIEAGLTAPPARVATLLGDAGRGEVLARKVLVRQDGVASELVTWWVPAALAEGTDLGTAEPLQGGVRGHLSRRKGARVDHVLEQVTARHPTSGEAKLLSVARSAAMLVMYVAARDASGGPVLVLEVVMPGDRHELEDAYQVG